MRFGGLLSFALGGTILLAVYWRMIAVSYVYTYEAPHFILVILFTFVGFLFLGYGIKSLIKETKQNPSKEQHNFFEHSAQNP